MISGAWENFVDRNAEYFTKSFPTLWVSVALEAKRVLIETDPVEISEETLIYRIAVRLKEYGRKPEGLRAIIHAIPYAKWILSVPWSVVDTLIQRSSIDELENLVEENLKIYADLLIEDYDELCNVLGESILTYEDVDLLYDPNILDIF